MKKFIILGLMVFLAVPSFAATKAEVLAQIDANVNERLNDPVSSVESKDGLNGVRYDTYDIEVYVQNGANSFSYETQKMVVKVDTTVDPEVELEAYIHGMEEKKWVAPAAETDSVSTVFAHIGAKVADQGNSIVDWKFGGVVTTELLNYTTIEYIDSNGACVDVVAISYLPNLGGIIEKSMIGGCAQ